MKSVVPAAAVGVVDGAARSSPAVGVLLVVLSATGFATKAIFVKLAYRHAVDAITLLALRMVFAQLFLVAFWLGRAALRADASAAGRTPPAPPARLTRRDLALLVGLGLLGYYASSLLDFLGLLYISAALERLILFLYPTLVVLISALWFRRPITRRVGLALSISYLGIGLVFARDLAAPQRGLLLGSALVFASTVTYSIYLVGNGELVRRLGARRVSDLVTSVSSAAVILQFVIMRPLAALAVPGPVYVHAAAMGLVSTVLPIYLLAAGVARLGASRAAMISAIGPVITIALGVVVLGESLGGLQMLGAGLVIVGVVVVCQAKQ